MNTYDHGAALNAQAGALEEALFERDIVIDQLTEIFISDGLQIGGRWYNRADANIYLMDSDRFADWQRRCTQPGLTAQDKADLLAEHDQMLEGQFRTYVEEVLEPMVEQEMQEDAA